ncbi:MAG: hypothetical protein ACLFNK_01870 [Candidatus Woesearchaeota archaeon]
MAFSKSFPKNVEGKNYPEWIDVYLSEREEKFLEEQVRQQNIVLMKQSMNDARAIAESSNLKDGNVISRMAVALFEKIASHSVHAKERRCKDKFDRSKDEK